MSGAIPLLLHAPSWHLQGQIWLWIYFILLLFFLWRCGPTRVMASSFTKFLDHTQRRITVGRTPLDEWSARRRDLYLTTHNNHNRQTSMPPGGIRTHDLTRRAATDLRLRPRGYWDRPSCCVASNNMVIIKQWIAKYVNWSSRGLVRPGWLSRQRLLFQHFWAVLCSQHQHTLVTRCGICVDSVLTHIKNCELNVVSKTNCISWFQDSDAL